MKKHGHKKFAIFSSNTTHSLSPCTLSHQHPSTFQHHRTASISSKTIPNIYHTSIPYPTITRILSHPPHAPTFRQAQNVKIPNGSECKLSSAGHSSQRGRIDGLLPTPLDLAGISAQALSKQMDNGFDCEGAATRARRSRPSRVYEAVQCPS